MYQFDSPALKVEKKKKIRRCQITKSLKIIKYTFSSANKVIFSCLIKNTLFTNKKYEKNRQKLLKKIRCQITRSF